MTAIFSEETIAQALNKLPARGQLAFALSCAERLFPNYRAFVREQGGGDADALRCALDMGWDILENQNIERTTLYDLDERVRAAEPETEDFNSILVSSALDAAAAAGLMLGFIDKGDRSTVVEIAALSRESVDMFVRAHLVAQCSGSELERRVAEHPLMQAELRRQHDDLCELVSFSGALDEVHALKAKWRDPEQSNIGQVRALPQV